MPKDASGLKGDVYLHTMVLGPPKAGKTVSCVKSAVESFGSGYVIECSSEEHLRTAQGFTEGKPPWQYDVVKNQEEFDAAIKCARRGAQEGKYKWVLVDDFNIFADRLEFKCSEDNRAGYVAYQQLFQLLQNDVLRLLDIPKCHILFTLHLTEVGDTLIDGQTSKKGKGIVPCLPGKSRHVVPGHFNQVVILTKQADGSRVFSVNPDNISGVGVGGGKVKGVPEVEADLGKLVALIGGQ